MAAQGTLTLSLPKPAVSGGPASNVLLTLTLGTDRTPTGAAFTSQGGISPGPAAPDDNAPCKSFDALVSSCTTLPSFLGLPLSAQAQCLCNVGPWDAVAAACLAQLTVLGQFYASSITSAGLIGLCSTYHAGPSWPSSVIASISSVGASAALTEGGQHHPTPSARPPTIVVTTSANSSVATPPTVTVTAPASSSTNAAPARGWPAAETWLAWLCGVLVWPLGL